MLFECKKYGVTPYGKWGFGIFKLGELCKVKMIFTLHTDIELEPNNTYKVKDFEIKQNKKGTLIVSLVI